MKRKSIKFVFAGLIIAAVFCITLFSFADEGKKGEKEGGRLAKMQETLGLSDAQVSSIKDVFTDTWKNIEPLMKQRKADFESLKEKVNAGASDNDLTALIETLKSDQQKIMDVRKNEMEQIKAILTPAQQAKAIIAMGERMGKWRHNRGEKEQDSK